MTYNTYFYCIDDILMLGMSKTVDESDLGWKIGCSLIWFFVFAKIEKISKNGFMKRRVKIDREQINQTVRSG